MTDQIDSNPGTAIAVVQESPLPVFGADKMAQAFVAYKQLQTKLDAAIPDSIMTIGKKKFRKKSYWRAVRTSFNLVVECINEHRIEVGDDWGYEVTYRATAANGSIADGDGACMASEKYVYVKDWEAWQRGGKRGKVKPVLDELGKPLVDWAETANNATLHNVRSHAHTRAFNRAVSNLVGFGEVSAEEMNQQAYHDAARDEVNDPDDPIDVEVDQEEDPVEIATDKLNEADTVKRITDLLEKVMARIPDGDARNGLLALGAKKIEEFAAKHLAKDTASLTDLTNYGKYYGLDCRWLPQERKDYWYAQFSNRIVMLGKPMPVDEGPDFPDDTE